MPPFTPLIINGQSVSSSTGSQYEVRNPFSGEVVSLAASASSADCKAAITSAHNAFKTWEQTSLSTRRDVLLRAADLVQTDRYKNLIIQAIKEETAASDEMCMFNWVTSAGFLKASASLTRDLGGERFSSDRVPGGWVLTEKKALGVIFTQSPWNAPVALTLRAVVVPILCGNTVVFRASELSPRSCAVVCELFQEAGLPDGVFNFLSISAQDTPERTKEIIAHPLVRKITFTGSDRVGRIIAMEAAKHLKPCVLELGGKAPAVVLNDAPVKEAAKHILAGAMLHSGQICMSTERVIAQSGVAEELFAEICSLANKLKSEQKLGALFSQDHAESVLGLVREAQKEGAQVLVGDVTRSGAVVNPHVLLVEKPNRKMRFWERESFGPVVLVTMVETVDEAVDLANASDYSLTSSLWTSDLYLAQQVASRINAGYTNINGSTIHSEPTLGLIGLGGSSGYGRFGVDDFTYTKSIVIHPPGQKSILFG
ncbi:vanillin dehydrogenase [Moniliophthora roreri MCA 2997]|uniref:Vanillin dehydrogenase n=1 Tax=Moniliophthora roreri (strain MCA 2997) TaxID=1381753 RepID=V2XIB9_MONRO|nr:vanillin dehydrogenase [Moniliophthora roreri MCA 2997]